MKRLPKTTAIKWLFLVTFYLLLFAIAQAKIYKSCEETRLEIGSSAVDGYYSIELANGVATSLYCKGKPAVKFFFVTLFFKNQKRLLKMIPGEEKGILYIKANLCVIKMKKKSYNFFSSFFFTRSIHM